MTKSENPWVSISPEDYEKHMGHPSVNQTEFMSKCFIKSIKNNKPESILIIGCGTGCGLEHVDCTVTKRVTAIDINAKFLEVLRKRYQHKIDGLEILNGDLYKYHFGEEEFSLIYAGLVFEFVEPKKVLKKISMGLRTGGKLEFVLQLPNDDLPQVSSTNIKSIQKLGSFARLVDVDQFCTDCKAVGLNLVESTLETIESGKSFFLGSVIKTGTP